MLPSVYGGLPGILAVVLIIPVFCLTGIYSFYGLEYLQFLPWLIPGGLFFVVSLFTWCVLYHFLTWRGTTPSDVVSGFASRPQDAPMQAAALAAATLAALTLIYLLLRHYLDAWCLFLKAPLSAFLVLVPLFGGAAASIRRLRRQAKMRTAFAILLVSDAAVSFALGQVLTLDHFRKGLEKHTQGFEQTNEIARSSRARFFIDYTSKEFALVWSSNGNRPDYRRPFPPELCLASPGRPFAPRPLERQDGDGRHLEERHGVNGQTEFLLFGLVMLAIASAYAFFLISRNAKLKRRLWPAYAIGGPILILAFFWLMGLPNELLYVATAVFALGALISLRAVKFCDACGATVDNLWRAAWLLPPARFCPKCGASLEQRR